MVASLQEDSEKCFFTAVDPMVATMLTSRHEGNEPKQSLHVDMETNAQCSLLA